jgi:CDP-diacylglycerol---serine O-phosphatidyltransferase
MNELSAQDSISSRRRRFGRTVFVLPSLFTVANIFCGYFAILSTTDGLYQHAAYAIGIAIILDSMDGYIARLTNTSSDFGLQLDSLADIVSFGIAPSILALKWGLSNVDERLAWITAFTFVICGATRLARFNIQAGNLKHFVGLPIPAAGGAIAAVVHFFKEPIHTNWGSGLMVAGVFLVSFLMISTIRYNSLKHLTLGRKSHLTVLVIALLFALIFFLTRPTLLILAAAYGISGPILRLYAIFQRKKSGENPTFSDPAQHL